MNTKKEAVWKLPEPPKETLIAKRTAPILKGAEQIVAITSDDHMLASGVVIQQIDDAVKWIEAVGRPFVKALDKMHSAGVKWLQGLERPLLDEKARLSSIRMAYRSKMQRAAEEAAAEAARVLQKKQQAELKQEAKRLERQGEEEAAALLRADAQKVPLPFVDVAPAVPKQAGFVVRKRWIPRIVDASLVPREYCSPDLKLIRPVIESLGPAANIPGVEVYEEEKEHSRAVV